MSTRQAIKFHFDPVKTRKGLKYSLTVYDSGVRRGYYKYIERLDYPLIWLLKYRQPLIENGYVKYRRKQVTVKGTGDKAEKLVVVFTGDASRNAQIYTLYLLSILNLRSTRRVEKLAKCFGEMDTISPMVDKLLDLQTMVEPKRFTQILRGYCLCLK